MEDLVDFVNKHTHAFDESHDINHALAVYYNAVSIANTDYPDICDPDIIMYGAILHDLCDYKYGDKTINKSVLFDFISGKLSIEKANIIMEVIENLSFSREINGLRHNVQQPYLDILSDADKLEAISLERCITFSRATNRKIPFDVIQHCHEKLLRLSSEFIRTKTGRAMSEPLHDNLVKDLEKLINGTYTKNRLYI